MSEYYSHSKRPKQCGNCDHYQPLEPDGYCVQGIMEEHEWKGRLSNLDPLTQFLLKGFISKVKEDGYYDARVKESERGDHACEKWIPRRNQGMPRGSDQLSFD